MCFMANKNNTWFSKDALFTNICVQWKRLKVVVFLSPLNYRRKSPTNYFAI